MTHAAASMKFEQIHPNRNYPDRVFKHVVTQIRKGRYKSGMRLVQRDLAEQLGVSQAPVREALEKLAEKGWVERRPGRGMFVKDYSNREDLRKLFEIRRALEVEAARLTAERVTNDQLKELNQLLTKLESADLAVDRETYREADVEFHGLIIRFCGNDQLEKLVEPIMQQNNCYKLQNDIMDTLFHLIRPFEQVYPRGHRGLYEALASHNPDQAGQLMHDHLQTLSPEQTAALIQKLQNH